MAVIALTFDTVGVGYDYATAAYDGLQFQTTPSTMTPAAATAATITPS